MKKPTKPNLKRSEMRAMAETLVDSWHLKPFQFDAFNAAIKRGDMDGYKFMTISIMRRLTPWKIAKARRTTTAQTVKDALEAHMLAENEVETIKMLEDDDVFYVWPPIVNIDVLKKNLWMAEIMAMDDGRY